MKFIESGIPGYDDLTISDEGTGGIPVNTNLLIYGPPKTGKTIFSNQFIYKGLLNQEPGLYITTDHGIKQLQSNMMDFQWFIQNYIQNQTLYVIDGISKLSGVNLEDTNTFKLSSINNPADLMVKVGIGTRFVYKKADQYRSALDSLTTLFAFNPEQMILRLLKAYLRRINEAGGTGIVTYTEGIVNPDSELMMKSLFHTTVKLDGENIHIETIPEDISEIRRVKSTYEITDNGIVVGRI